MYLHKLAYFFVFLKKSSNQVFKMFSFRRNENNVLKVFHRFRRF